ncbi:hypothetical protein [Bradyrhizobium sp. USDA 4522]
MNDPTDNALAAIASILDQTTTPPETSKPTDKTADKPVGPAAEPPASIAMPPPLPPSIQVESIAAVSVEAAPAEPPSIEEPEPVEQPEASKAEAGEPEPTEPEPSQQPEAEPEPMQPPPQPIEANGYSKSGPGPMAALRFRWTVRQDGAQYYVDETVGEASTPLVNGPMDRDAAIKFVDDREAQARRRFEHFKHEMLSRTASVVQASKDSNEA